MSRVYSNSGVHVNLFQRDAPSPASRPLPICDGVGAVPIENKPRAPLFSQSSQLKPPRMVTRC